MQRYTRDKLLSLARDLAKTYGESLTLTAFRRETGLSQHLIFDLCGTWCELRTAIGLTPEAPRARNKISNEAILEKLKSAIAEHGENLSETRFCELTKLSGTMLSRRFGTWGQLRQQVGLSPRAKIEQRYTDDQIFQDIFDVVARIHSKPSFRKYTLNGGKISAQTVRDRFGTWEDAMEAFQCYLDRRFSKTVRTRYVPDETNPNAYFIYRGDELIRRVEIAPVQRSAPRDRPVAATPPSLPSSGQSQK